MFVCCRFLMIDSAPFFGGLGGVSGTGLVFGD